MKQIVALWGPSDQGKTKTIKKLIPHFKKHYPKAIFIWLKNEDCLDEDKDIIVIIEINGFRIGIVSKGDPGHNLKSKLRMLVEEQNCDLIICACRTRGKTVKDIEEIAKEFDYGTIWVTNYRAGYINHNTLNKLSAQHIFEMIQQVESRL